MIILGGYGHTDWRPAHAPRTSRKYTICMQASQDTLPHDGEFGRFHGPSATTLNFDRRHADKRRSSCRSRSYAFDILDDRVAPTVHDSIKSGFINTAFRSGKSENHRHDKVIAAAGMNVDEKIGQREDDVVQECRKALGSRTFGIARKRPVHVLPVDR
jgi:hypothetical protein